MLSSTSKSFFSLSIFSDFRFIYGIYFLLILFATIRIVGWEGSNNYSIFYYSLYHLLEVKSLYALYPAQYEDHYHYAPAFAAIFAPIFALPYSVGLFFWQLLFAGVWVYAIQKLPITNQQKVFAYWFGLHELFTSIVNSQTNPLITALSIFAFISFEKKQPFWAAFFIMIGFNIKIYSLVAAGLFILYPKKGVFIASMILWSVVLGLLPLLLTSPAKLLWQYELWIRELFIKTDSDKWLNISIHRLIHLSISPNIATASIIGIGVVLFCTVYIHRQRYSDYNFRILLLASILVFQVVFNPVAESPAYIIAVTGVLCWWFVCPKSSLDWILLLSCFILTVMSPSDIFPATIRMNFVVPYSLKALPCVLIWFRILYLMHFPQPTVHQQNLDLD
ncbi:DUF2029 domain-containing protein [Spirosoma sp. KCTC 42546]|uniref:glycosyltransferase 87 family protein n=1 Tax=Spirosoma sp. KCTC 42546 TaxID=2520506 RepID=UPI001157A5E1|nr:glycosyltransferase 87 family protein [Spirosoma sp. KCTC 42546]QDK81876.1 DUF2029 domain-containing protein [Spirosoma sp. KCTC 42546]